MKRKIFFSVSALLISLTFVLKSENLTVTSLKTDEINALTFMREEELLAHDVYYALSEIYSKPVFRNISKSEAIHSDAVKSLLKKFEIKDPAVDHKPGVFINEQLQKLYNELIETGKQSLVGALNAGAIIEDTDIADLERLNDKIENMDIKIVFDNLIRGSRNHLRAFHKNLTVLGITFTPRYLTQEQYNNIVKSPHETGNGSCMKAQISKPE